MAGAQPDLVRALRLEGGERIVLRPIGPADAAVLQAYVRRLSSESRYNRFLGALQELPHAELDRVLHLDRKCALALIAEVDVDGDPIVIAEARHAFSPDCAEAELALSVAEAWRRKGVGALIVADAECRARGLGVRQLAADVLRSNEPMKALARKTGFHLTDVLGDARLVRIVKDMLSNRVESVRAAASDVAIAA